MPTIATRTKPIEKHEPIMRDGRELVARMDARFQPDTYDAQAGTITVSLGTGAPVQRYSWRDDDWFIEVLDMKPESWRLERMNAGAPFLANHNQYSLDAIIGSFVPGTVRIENGELIGNVKLSTSERAKDNVNDILSGVIRNTSVGYLVHGWKDDGLDEETELRIFRAIDIEGLEGSAVGVPADITGGIRSAAADHKMEAQMSEVTKTEAAASENTAERIAEPVTVDERKLKADAVDAYKVRCAELKKYGERTGATSAEVDAVIATDCDVDSGIRALLDQRAERDGKMNVQGRIDITKDARDNKRELVQGALEARAHLTKEPNHDAMREFGALSMVEIIRDYLGNDTRSMSRGELFKRMTSSDFPLILANLANKTLLARTEASAEYRWYEQVFTRMDYNDFRAHSTPWLGAATSLAQVNEGDNYTLGTASERNESTTAFKYGKDFDYTFEMMVNDDLNAFTMLPMIIGEAAWRKASDLCAALLSGNQTMGDGVVLFHTASHANLSTSGGVPTAARLNELDQFCLNQTRAVPGGGVERIGTAAKFLLIPASLKPTIKQMFLPVSRPDYTTEVVAMGVEEQNRIVVPSFTGPAYYAATGRIGSARYGFLRDEGGLVVTQYPTPEADKVSYHAHMVFGAHVNKWEDFASNPGV